LADAEIKSDVATCCITLTGLSLLCVWVVYAFDLKGLNRQKGFGECMFKTDVGKLTLYASNTQQRLQTVKAAAENMAKQLNLNFEVIKPKTACAPIYVYYEEVDAEPVPVYCDEGKTGDPEEIASKMKNMMFVLSFHPQHVGLKQARRLLTLS
jgi:hypothetical protein